MSQNINHHPYLVSHVGNVVAAFPISTDWELEEMDGSTNRLVLTVPNSFEHEVKSDMGIFFEHKRFVVTSVESQRLGEITIITADEAQILLSTKIIQEYILDRENLRSAVAIALEGTNWSVGETPPDTRGYSTHIERESVMRCLRFIESQSGFLLHFDSEHYQVNLMNKVETENLTQVFRYKKNLQNIIKTETQPLANIIYPIGRDGMTIASVNGGKEYLEDFSWYIELGMTEAEAREKYSKETVWENQNFVFPGNMLRAAEQRLSYFSRPQINYRIDGALIDEAIQLGDVCYVADEELGIRLKTKVTRIIRSKDKGNNAMELDYIPSSLTFNLDTTFSDASEARRNEVFFGYQNDTVLLLRSDFEEIFLDTINVFAETYFEISLTCILENSGPGLVEGYWRLDGNSVGVELKQTVFEGYHTLSANFVVDGVQEGLHTLSFLMKSSTTTLLPVGQTQATVRTTAALTGGTGYMGPDRTIIETIPVLPLMVLSPITTNVRVEMGSPLGINLSDSVELASSVITVEEEVNATFQTIGKGGLVEEDD